MNDLDHLHFLESTGEYIGRVQRFLARGLYLDRVEPRFNPETAGWFLFSEWFFRQWGDYSDYRTTINGGLEITRLARVAVALERYRNRTHELPETVAAVVPEYLSALPSDPLDGGAVRYRKLAGGYAIYFLTRKGEDDGGNRDAASATDVFVVTRLGVVPSRKVGPRTED